MTDQRLGQRAFRSVFPRKGHTDRADMMGSKKNAATSTKLQIAETLVNLKVPNVAIGITYATRNTTKAVRWDPASGLKRGRDVVRTRHEHL